MNVILNNPSFALALTLTSFFIAQKIYKKLKSPILHPVLISVATIILILKLTNINYNDYKNNANYIHMLLGPSVVALALPLYHQRNLIRKFGANLFFSIACGSFTGIFSAILISKYLGASNEIIRTMAPKSVTTPIAMGVAEKISGIPSLTAVIVVITGIFGAAFGPAFLKIIKIKSKTAIGTALGTAAHGIGTARANEEGEQQGAFSGLALAISGIITAIIAPHIANWMIP